eukprot:15480777-Alexandrium_andersonii.AAC.1
MCTDALSAQDECYADTVIGYFERKLVTNPQDVQNAFNNRKSAALGRPVGDHSKGTTALQPSFKQPFSNFLRLVS